MAKKVVVETAHEVLAEQALLLVGRRDKMRGLIRGDHDAAVLRCRQVHTIGMRQPIDVLFVDGENRVVHVVREMRPVRVSRWVKRAAYVIELPAGSAAPVESGDLVAIRAVGSRDRSR